MFRHIFLLFLLIILLSAETGYTQTGTYGEAMSQALSCEAGLYSVGNNPAGTAVSTAGAAIGYTSRFGLSEMSEKSVSAALPLGGGAVSAGFQYYGFQLYNTMSAHLTYAMPLGENWYAGAGIRWHQLHIDDTPQNYHAASGDIGLQYRATSQLTVGTWIGNITNSQYQDSDSTIPTRIQAGFRYTIHGGHALSMDLEKNSLQSSIRIHCAASIQLTQGIRIMAGISSQPTEIGAGLEITVHGFRMLFAASHHEMLGWNPSASVAWSQGVSANDH